MIGVDTNVLLRLLVDDGSSHSQSARAFFYQRSARSPAFVGAIVLAETMWLLRRRFGFGRRAINDVVRMMLTSRDFRIEYADDISAVLEENEDAELPDHLIALAAAEAGCAKTFTFDRKASKRVQTMELLA